MLQNYHNLFYCGKRAKTYVCVQLNVPDSKLVVLEAHAPSNTVDRIDDVLRNTRKLWKFASDILSGDWNQNSTHETDILFLFLFIYFHSFISSIYYNKAQHTSAVVQRPMVSYTSFNMLYYRHDT